MNLEYIKELQNKIEELKTDLTNLDNTLKLYSFLLEFPEIKSVEFSYTSEYDDQGGYYNSYYVDNYELMPGFSDEALLNRINISVKKVFYEYETVEELLECMDNRLPLSEVWLTVFRPDDFETKLSNLEESYSNLKQKLELF